MSNNEQLSIGLNELVDYKKKTYSPFMDKVMKFLWKCGGADPQILQYCPYSDHIKNAGIGGVVLATSVMAALAMGFAMHTIFASPNTKGMIDEITGQPVLEGKWFITIPVSIVWGLIIFNLDRFIVTTVKGDGTEKITLGEFWSMLPRLAMAILIGLTISAPFETYIFKREIHREWDLVKEDLKTNALFEIRNRKNIKSEGFETQLKQKEDEVRRQQDVYNKINQEYIDQMQGRLGQQGYGPRAKQLEKSKDVELAKLNKIIAERDILSAEINKQNKEANDSIAGKANDINKFVPGFLDQLMMLERLSSEGKTVNQFNAKGETIEEKKELYGSAFWPIWLVRLLFMIVEIAPVIFKFMIWKSSYDYMQDNVSQILEAKQGISLEHITDENNQLHKVKENYNARRIVEVSKRQNELEKENAIHAITLFAEKEREEIENNPEKFIKETESGNKQTETNTVENPS